MEGIFTDGSFFKRLMSGRPITGIGLVIILVGTFFFIGCKKSQPPTTQAPPPAADTNESPAAMRQTPQYASTPIIVAPSPEGGADLKQLNHAYIGWIVQNRRRPKSFDEFVTLSGIQIPPPPTGKKYVIDKYGYINLAGN